mgnify:FL=1
MVISGSAVVALSTGLAGTTSLGDESIILSPVISLEGASATFSTGTLFIWGLLDTGQDSVYSNVSTGSDSTYTIVPTGTGASWTDVT